MQDKVVFWIKQKVRDSGARGIVLGLSGGIDSAVVAALAKRAVGKNNLLVLFLPCNSNPQDLRDARLVARNFGLKSKLVDLSGVYNNFIKVLPASSPPFIPKPIMAPAPLERYFFARAASGLPSRPG